MSPIEDNQEPAHAVESNPSFGMPSDALAQRREASLNWLALGLLLAAWNAVGRPSSTGPQPRARPESLRGVSVCLGAGGGANYGASVNRSGGPRIAAATSRHLSATRVLIARFSIKGHKSVNEL